MNLSDKLKTRRMQLGMTLEEVAKIVGVNPATVFRWEKGEIENIRSSKISLLASALKVPTSFILNDDIDDESITKTLNNLDIYDDKPDTYQTKSFDEFLKDLNYNSDIENAIILNKSENGKKVELVSIPSTVYSKMLKLFKVFNEED